MGLRRLQLMQAAGCDGATHIASLAAVWSEPAGSSTPPYARVATTGKEQTTCSGRGQLVCAKTFLYENTLAGLLDCERTVSAPAQRLIEGRDTQRLVLRGIVASVATLHSLDLCCGTTLSAHLISFEGDPSAEQLQLRARLPRPHP